MYLLWKTASLVAIIMVIQFNFALARHTKIGQFVSADDTKIMAPEYSPETKDFKHTCIVHGRILCNGKPILGLRPYLASDEYPKMIIHISVTDEDGWYRLVTPPFFVLKHKADFFVRHQCPIDNLRPMPKCAIPYFTTHVLMDITNTTYIIRDFELSKMKGDSSSDCLY